MVVADFLLIVYVEIYHVLYNFLYRSYLRGGRGGRGRDRDHSNCTDFCLDHSDAVDSLS